MATFTYLESNVAMKSPPSTIKTAPSGSIKSPAPAATTSTARPNESEMNKPSSTKMSSKGLKPPYIEHLEATLKSLSIDPTTYTSNDVPKMIQSPQRQSHSHKQPSYFQDKGLSCLLQQLGSVNEKIRYNNSLKQALADYEEEYKRDLAASLAKSMMASTKDDTPSKGLWVKYYDDEVGAEYFYNTLTGEASWVDPDTM